MSVNSSDSKNICQCEIRSKYFTERPVMEESLTDFQEKKNFTAPKKTLKATTKNNPKKSTKRIKGQKDIRSALKSKKHELVAYANDFDKVCKLSGIDVDSEQLQLAITLSKSLQRSEGVIESGTSQSLGILTSQERTGKIRTTLLEYGFKVPEIKITATKSRKLKKHIRNYKLLQASEAEKQQLIFDRYSQILFQNITTPVEHGIVHELSESRTPLYDIATAISYETVKSFERFYIKDLLEINHVTAGALLKDWSDIPGRPSTPLIEQQHIIKFPNINCSQEELDIILAGTIQSAQKIVKIKYKMSCDLSFETDGPMQTCEDIVNHPLMIMDTKSPQTLSVKSQIRSCSPDIFDDEVTSIIDMSKKDIEELSQENLCKDVIKSKSSYMDLTECVNFSPEKSLNIDKTSFNMYSKIMSQPSQDENITKRKSNDFMEITECVARSSQPVTNKEIDLTQNLAQCISNKKFGDIDNFKNKDIESMDLTQSSDSNDSLPFVQICGKDKTLDDTIILTNDVYPRVKPLQVNSNKEVCCYNILQDSKILLNFNDNEKSLVLVDCESDNRGSCDNNMKRNKSEHKENKRKSYINNIPKESVVSKCESFFEEFVHPHSDSSKDNSEDVLCVNDSPNNSAVKECFSEQQNNDDRDLTQSCGSSIEKNDLGVVKSKHQSGYESFSGRKENNIVQECITNDDIMSNDIMSNDIDLTQGSGSSVESVFEARNIHKNENTFEDEISVTERHDTSIRNESDNSLCKEFDLTQSCNLSSENMESVNSNKIGTKKNSMTTKISDASSLGKIGDISIDYDEIFDDVIASHTNKTNKLDSSEVNNSTGKLKQSYSSVSNSSEISDVFVISDNEFNYSINQSKFEIVNRNFDIGGLSIMDDLSKASGSKLSINVENSTEPRISMNESFLPEANLVEIKYNQLSNVAVTKTTPFRNVINKHKICTNTPANSDYIIKTDQVTPMMEYESLTTPERNRELDKYGLKPFKRKRAVQLLTHLYNQTHPIVESCADEELPSPSKKQKKDDYKISNTQVCTFPNKLIKSSAKPKCKSPRKNSEAQNTVDINILEEINKENEDLYRVTNEVPEIKNIECSEEDWVFQKREKAKVHSCRVPLHIAFHNYISCRQGLREAILRYEPVNIDVIHTGLIDCGHKYDAKELLKFMDKKCITVKTADNNTKANRKHY